MQTDKEFEDFFRERLEGLEETPPMNAWDKIKEDIKPPRTYYREMAAIMLLCLISAFIYLGIKKQPGQTGQPEIAMAPNQGNTTKNQLPETKTSRETMVGNTRIAEMTYSAQKTETSGEKQNSEPAKTSEEIAAPNLNSAPTISANSSIKNQPVEANLPLMVVKKNKIRKAITEGTVNKENHLETALALNTKTASPAVFSAEKRYGSEVKNATETVASKSEKAPATTKEINQAATAANAGILAETKTTNPENATFISPKTESILALKKPARVDSVALLAIPAIPADSINKSVAKQDPEAKGGKFAITVNFTPGVIARRLIANPTDDQYLQFSEGSKKDKTDLGFDLSATVHQRISPKTTVDAGFSYTKLSTNVNYQISKGNLNVIAIPVQGGQSAAVAVDYNFADAEFQNEFAYGGVRVGLSQDLVKTKANTIFVSGGAGLNKLLSNTGTLSTTQTNSNGVTTETTVVENAFHTVNSHVYLTAGLERAVLPKVSILVSPAFTYYLNSAMQKKHIFEMKPYTFGLNFGLRYQL